MRQAPTIVLFVTLLAFLGPIRALADNGVLINNFGSGLNTQDNSAEISPSSAQDLLNVNLQPGGASVFKRDGYGLFQSLPIACSTCAVHGGYHFQQVGGNDVQLWGNDTELAASVNDATFVKLATGTVSATWQCADSQGFAYCLDSTRDTPIKTDGSAANTTFQTAIPLGTMVTFTPLQLVVAGVSGNESTLYISGQNTFTTFTIGVLPSSPFIEPIASPGSRITHIAYYFGKLFWWKDQSFGYATFTNQNDWQLTIVSNQIGTLDNSDAFWNSSGFDSGAKFSGTQQANAQQSPGGIFFRGQDNHFYVYDGYYLTRISRPITPTITAANRRKSNAWTQTTQADWQASSFFPSSNFSTTISAGDVVLSTFNAVDTSSADFSGGQFVNTALYSGNSVNISTNSSGDIENGSFETAGSDAQHANNWTFSGSGPVVQRSNSNTGGPNCSGQPGPLNGTWELAANMVDTGSNARSISLLDFSGIAISTVSLDLTSSNCSSWNTGTISMPSSYIGKRFKVRIRTTDTLGTNDAITNSSFVYGGTVTFHWQADKAGTGSSGNGNWDFIQGGSSTVTSGQFTSRVFDTGTLGAIVYPTANWTVNTSTPSFEIQTSATGSAPWSSVSHSSGTNVTTNRYVRYLSSFTVSGTDNALSTLDDVTIVAQSTGGIFVSQIKNAPALTSWSNFTATDQTTGGTLVYYTRSSTGNIIVGQSTPTWVLQGKNATVAASTNTFFQARVDFTATSATGTLALNDFTFNWFEGSASDKAYITYFNDAIWFSVSASSSVSTNNRVFYWDLLNGAWLIYDIPANGFQIENNALYFGSPVTGSVYKFGGVTTDNGSAINSYWKSKDFTGADPFVENTWDSSDFIVKEASTTLNVLYTLNASTTTIYTLNLFDSTKSILSIGKNLAAKNGKLYNVQFGNNNSQTAWTVMGHRVRYTPYTWKPTQ